MRSPAGTPSLRYNESNRLVEADDPANPATVLGQYTYDAFGRRVQKVADVFTTVYLYDLSGHLVETVNTSTLPEVVRDAIYLEDELVAVVDQETTVGASALPLFRRPLPPLSPRGWVLLLTGSAGLVLLFGGGTSRRPRAAEAGFALIALAVVGAACGGPAVSIAWVHTDYLGKPLVVTNSPTDGSAPAKIWTATYEPYGLATPNTDPSGTGNHFTLDFRFPGQVYDAEIGMHYNMHRIYDPASGRYLETDPVGQSGGVNVYTYAANVPAQLTDADGQNPVAVAIAACVADPACAALAGATAAALGSAVANTWNALHNPPVGPVAPPDPNSMAKGGRQRVTSSDIEALVGQAMSALKLKGEKPPSRCEMLQQLIDEGLIDPYEAIPTQKAWGCRKSTQCP